MKYIRVSEILARLQNFGAIDPLVLQNKAEIGTRTHQAITADANGETLTQHCERSAAYFKSYQMFKSSFEPNFIMLETRMYEDNLMITGEVDAVVRKNNELIILDWKTSAKANPKIWEMQAHFYWYILNANKIPVSNKMIWVSLRQKKQFILDDEGNQIFDDLGCAPLYEYVAQTPKSYEFTFNKSVMENCILEAQKCWDEKRDNFDID